MYFIFDMDETLAELYTMFYFIGSLRLKDTVLNENANANANANANEIPSTLTKSLNKAYKKFVAAILKEEVSNPLGILRPGILKVMSKLDKQKCIIYSNSGHLQNLEFIRDLINLHVGSKLIKQCIHYYHPVRVNHYYGPVRVNGDKKWNEIKSIINKNDLNESDVYFFDDLVHKDLYENLTHYYKVPAYNFKASFHRIADIYREAIKDVNSEMYLKYIPLLINRKPKSIENMIRIFKNKTNISDRSNKVPLPDAGIDMMMSAIKTVKNKTRKRST